MAKEKKPKLEDICLVPEDPANAGPERLWCQKCELFKGAKSPFMKAEVPKEWEERQNGTLLVGEAPGADEDNQPFTGRSGQILRTMLADTGLTPTDTAFTNGCRCRPPNNATPSMTQLRCCRPFLLWEINHLQPKTVLALGTSALRSLTNDGQATVTRYRGRELEIPQIPQREPPR